MPFGRRTTPLFDLVSKGGAERPATPSTPRAAKPIVRVELKPGPAEPIDREPAPRAAPAQPSQGVPVNYWYLGGAALLLVGILAWAGGVMFGRSQEQARVERKLADSFGDRPSITEPASQSPSPQPSLTPGVRGGATDARPEVSPPSNPPAVPTSSGPILSARGMIADPRQKGLNYLNLASLPRPDAEGAIAFLAANGLDVAGVPVDPPAWAPKNQGSPVQWYALVVSQGLTREQLGLDARTTLESQVSKLGQIWQKQHRGSSNFSRPAWQKF